MATKRLAADVVAKQFEPLVATRYVGIQNPKPELVTTFRPRNNLVKSPKLKAINDCMREKLQGQKFKSIDKQRQAFVNARKECIIGEVSTENEQVTETKRKK